MGTIYETFWDHVDMSGGPTACWPWQRAIIKPWGYGSLAVPGRLNQQAAHRIAYEKTVGPIPKGLVVRHTCDNPPCVNPRHLLLGTQGDNMRDRSSRGRCGDVRPKNPERGEARYNAKLTDEIVRDVRANGLRGLTISAAAREIGVSRATLRAVLDGRGWKHVTVD